MLNLVKLEIFMLVGVSNLLEVLLIL